MKAVMREIAQAKTHYARLPLFEFLRSEAIAPRDRLAFFPCMAPFILAFSDLNRYVLREEPTEDPHQKLVNTHSHEDDHHWPWYLEDFAKLGCDRTMSLAHALRTPMKDEMRQNRMLMPRLAQLAVNTTPVEKLVIVESIEETGNVLFGLTMKIARRIQAEGGPELRYLGQFHFARETGHAMHGLDHRVLEAIELTPTERMRCLDLSFQVFDLFVDWTAELLAFATDALAQRTMPQLMHGRTA